jgi:hypothetical protein
MLLALLMGAKERAMDVNLDADGVEVELSERNLRDLLAIYELQGEASLGRMTSAGYVSVTVKPNDVHYLGRTPGVGSGLVA